MSIGFCSIMISARRIWTPDSANSATPASIPILASLTRTIRDHRVGLSADWASQDSLGPSAGHEMVFNACPAMAANSNDKEGDNGERSEEKRTGAQEAQGWEEEPAVTGSVLTAPPSKHKRRSGA
jgi:hypothetical protein